MSFARLHLQVLISICLISLVADTRVCEAEKSSRARFHTLPGKTSLNNIEESMSQPRLNATQSEELARMLGMSQDSMLFRALLSGDEQKLNALHPENLSPKKGAQTPKVLQHLKNSNNGLRLSSAQDIINNTRINIDRIMQLANKMLQDQVDATRRSLQLKPIPTCELDKREVIARGKIPKTQQRSAEFDILYINKNDQSFSPDLSLGDNLKIKVYDPDQPNLYAYSLKGMGIDCLPYRLRLTNSHIYKLRGKPALEDFSNKKKNKVAQKLSARKFPEKLMNRRHK